MKLTLLSRGQRSLRGLNFTLQVHEKKMGLALIGPVSFR